ncbi:SWPV1-153 [Shearwaterpox virus]|uniref:SWPV1-153 n=1 Tax=Shearwaterpox virus TaxID=1974596 RepID=A0A1V0QGV9_CNPV|nr:SWPV1-153 [Shearwaterpox virus]
MDREDSKNVIFSPVFIEPRFKHNFLSSTRYFYILVFEVIVALIIINFFFREEILYVFLPLQKTPKNSINSLLDKTFLKCEDDGSLMIVRPSGTYPALNLDDTPVQFSDCSLLLSSLNGGNRSTSPYSIFNR